MDKKRRTAVEDTSLEWVLTHSSGRRDVIIGVLPPIPIRFAVLAAWKDAQGWVEAEVVDTDTGAVTKEWQLREELLDGPDLAAVGWAALGLCWAQPELAVSKEWRALGRDPYRFGDAVMTALWDLGYRNLPEIAKAGRRVLEAMQAATFDDFEEVEEHQEDFSGAQQQS